VERHPRKLEKRKKKKKKEDATKCWRKSLVKKRLKRDMFVRRGVGREGRCGEGRAQM